MLGTADFLFDGYFGSGFNSGFRVWGLYKYIGCGVPGNWRSLRYFCVVGAVRLGTALPVLAPNILNPENPKPQTSKP